jgi:hypothetical protein
MRTSDYSIGGCCAVSDDRVEQRSERRDTRHINGRVKKPGCTCEGVGTVCGGRAYVTVVTLTQ